MEIVKKKKKIAKKDNQEHQQNPEQQTEEKLLAQQNKELVQKKKQEIIQEKSQDPDTKDTLNPIIKGKDELDDTIYYPTIDEQPYQHEIPKIEQEDLIDLNLVPKELHDTNTTHNIDSKEEVGDIDIDNISPLESMVDDEFDAYDMEKTMNVKQALNEKKLDAKTILTIEESNDTDQKEKIEFDQEIDEIFKMFPDKKRLLNILCILNIEDQLTELGNCKSYDEMDEQIKTFSIEISKQSLRWF